MNECHEDIWGSGATAPLVLTSALDAGELVSFTPLPLYLQAKSPLNRRRVVPRAGLEAMEERKILNCRESNPARPSRTRRYTD
jgi:hypothetical protein